MPRDGSSKGGDSALFGTLSAVPNSIVGHRVMSCLSNGQILECKKLCKRARRVVETDGAAAAIGTWLSFSFRWDPPVALRSGASHHPQLPPVLLPAAPDTERRVERFVAASGWSGWRIGEIFRGVDPGGAGVVAWAGSPTGGFARLLQRFCKETDSIKLSTASDDDDTRSTLTPALVESIVQALFTPCYDGPIVHGAAASQYSKATTVFALPSKPDGTVKVLKADALLGIWKPGKDAGDGAGGSGAGSGGHLTFKFVASASPDLADLGSRQAKRAGKDAKRSGDAKKPSHGRRLAFAAFFNALAPPPELGSAAGPPSALMHEVIGYSGPPIALPDAATRPALRCVHIGLGKGRVDCTPLALTTLSHLILDRTPMALADALVSARDPLPLECLVLRGLHGRPGGELAPIAAAGLSRLRVLHLASDQPRERPVDNLEGGWGAAAFASTIEELFVMADVAVHEADVATSIATFATACHRLQVLDVRPCSASFNPGPTKLTQALSAAGPFPQLAVLGLGRLGVTDAAQVPVDKIVAPSLRLAVHLGECGIALATTDPVVHDVRVQLDSLYQPGLLLANESLLRRKAAGALPPPSVPESATLPVVVDATNMVGPEYERRFEIENHLCRIGRAVHVKL